MVDQTYSFKSKIKNYWQLQKTRASLNSVQNFKAIGKAVLLLAIGEHDNLWVLLILLQVHRQNFPSSSFNLARSTCSFNWCYIFSFVIIFTNISFYQYMAWLAHLVSRFTCNARVLVDASSNPPFSNVKSL